MDIEFVLSYPIPTGERDHAETAPKRIGRPPRAPAESLRAASECPATPLSSPTRPKSRVWDWQAPRQLRRKGRLPSPKHRRCHRRCLGERPSPTANRKLLFPTLPTLSNIRKFSKDQTPGHNDPASSSHAASDDNNKDMSTGEHPTKQTDFEIVSSKNQA